MKSLILTVAVAAGLASFGVAPVDARSQEDCNNMLTLAVGNALQSQGFDTSNVCDLTLAQLATIKAAIEQDGMNNASRQLIERILGAVS